MSLNNDESTRNLFDPAKPEGQPLTDQLNGANGAATNGADGFDIKSLYWSTGIGDPLAQTGVGVVFVGRPTGYFRVDTRVEYRKWCELLTFKAEGAIEKQLFIIAPRMRGMIDDARRTLLVTAVDRVGNPMLIPLTYPKDDERDFIAWSSMREVAKAAQTNWVKARWAGSNAGFAPKVADPGFAPDPDFSKLPPFEELMERAFKGQSIIHDESHAVYREVMGKAGVGRRFSDDDFSI